MIILYFLYGLCFEGLGLTAYLQMRRGGDFPLRKQLPWLAAFGFTSGAAAWIDMFLASGPTPNLVQVLTVARMVIQPLSGLLLLIFGWGILARLTPLPSWTIFIPGVMIVPIAFIITFAATTFITPSPLEIPIDIWSRYLLYLPGSIMAGAGFLRQWIIQRKRGFFDVSTLMFGAGIAFLFEAFVVGLVIPAAPYGPASYYNYDRGLYDAFVGEQTDTSQPFNLVDWLDYENILHVTGLPIEFWRMISAAAVTFFVIHSLDVFDALQKRQMKALQDERDRAQHEAFEAQIAARQAAESWTEALVSINRRIAMLEDVDHILLHITENGRVLLHSDYMAIAILGEENTTLNLKCQASREGAQLIDPAIRIINPWMLDRVLAGQPFHSTGMEPLERFEGICQCAGVYPRTMAVVPLTLDNNPIGALWLMRTDDQLYSETDLIWLECLADQVVIAIQHGLMTSQMQSLSVVEERARIAREMHDGLAQVLGYLNLQVQTLDVLLQKGKMESLAKELRHLREAVQTAHADVRENILSLRTTLANETGLVPAMEEYIKEFSIQTGIDSQFINQVGEDLELSSIAEVQLVCILQEALTNVRKHAIAERVWVRVHKEEGEYQDSILVEVEDDGIGFDAAASNLSFGLQTMLERAHGVQGDLWVSSASGQGTRVELRLPCVDQEKFHNRSLVLS